MNNVVKIKLFLGVFVALFSTDYVWAAPVQVAEEKIYKNFDDYINECLQTGKRIGAEGYITYRGDKQVIGISGTWAVIDHIRKHCPQDIATLRPNRNPNSIENKKKINMLWSRSEGKVVEGIGEIDWHYGLHSLREPNRLKNTFLIPVDMAYDLPEELEILGFAKDKKMLIVKTPNIENDHPSVG